MTAVCNGGVFQGANPLYRVEIKKPLFIQGSVIVWRYIAMMVSRPNVPQMAELPCNLCVVDFTPLQGSTSLTVIVEL